MERFGVIRGHIGDDYIVPYDEIECACAWCESCCDCDELLLIIEFGVSGDFRDFVKIANDLYREGLLHLIPNVIDLVEKDYSEIADEAKDGLLYGLEFRKKEYEYQLDCLKAAIAEVKHRGAQRIFVG